MSLLDSMNIIGSGLTAERFRMNIALQNITNQNTTRTANGEPYRRKQVVFYERGMSFSDALRTESAKVEGGGVRVTEVVESQRDFIPVYDPDHPDANEDAQREHHRGTDRPDGGLQLLRGQPHRPEAGAVPGPEGPGHRKVTPGLEERKAPCDLYYQR